MPEIKATVRYSFSEWVGHLYYIAIDGRRSPPYKRQIEVRAIIDISDDGTLAGVELIDDMPPPPSVD